MRGRTVLFIALAVVMALVGVYVGWSTSRTTAVGEPSTAPPADSSAGSVQRRPTGPGSLRPPAASSKQTSPPRAAGNPGGTATQPDDEPAPNPPTKPAKDPAAQPQPQPSDGPVRFGDVATTPSDIGVVTSIAPSDRRALTTTFDNMQVGDGEPVTQPDTTRSFSMRLPLSDGAKGQTLRVYVQGFANVQEDASARLTLKLNGHVKVRDYPSGWDDEVFEVFELPAIPATTYKLWGVLEVHQNPGTASSAYLNVLSVDASIG